MRKRLLPIVLLALACLLPGCAWFHGHHQSKPATAQPAQAKSIVTLDQSLIATVLIANNEKRYVILNFPDGRMPKQDQHLFLYRNGLKAAEVKISGPQAETRTAADLVSGEAQAGDSVRDQ